MAAQCNFFALLGDDENEDPVAIVATLPAIVVAKTQPSSSLPAKLPTKPPSPAQAVREAQQSSIERGSGRRGGRGNSRGSDGDRQPGYGRQNQDGGFQGDNEAPNGRVYTSRGGGRGRGGGGYYGGGAGRNYRDSQQVENGNHERPYEASRGQDWGRERDGGEMVNDGGRGRGRGGVSGRGYGNTDGFGRDNDERFRRRDFDRRSGTGRGTEMKRDGSGQGNWGTETEQVQQDSLEPVLAEEDKLETEKKTDEETAEVAKPEDKKEEEEDKEMTLDEYEKVLSEKRKALEALKAHERKVELDKDFESMQLVEKKRESGVTLKLSEKEKGKKKEIGEKDEKPRKAVSINEFLKPGEKDEYFSPSGRRGRGGRGRGGFRGGFGGGGDYNSQHASAPVIEDPGQFPSLSGAGK